jgi:hypothetical protein
MGCRDSGSFKPLSGLTLAQGDTAEIRGDTGTHKETAGSCQAASLQALPREQEGNRSENNNKYRV